MRAPHAQSLSAVQHEIEILLASRPIDDFTPPDGYRSLVLLETVLLNQVSSHESALIRL